MMMAYIMIVGGILGLWLGLVCFFAYEDKQWFWLSGIKQASVFLFGILGTLVSIWLILEGMMRIGGV